MKLFEVLKPNIDWNTKSEKQQIAMVQRELLGLSKIQNPSEAVQIAAVSKRGLAIQDIENQSEAVQLAAFKENTSAIHFFKNPTQKVLLKCLTSQEFINCNIGYNQALTKFFANNTLLMKKWLRYGEVMRNH
ncbi:hypothetical protein M0R04_07100 [Candidatus Dojkabacteria bacterium]|jgi:hypothetical protein|nr:hypothetical protein [Candidatus Dojkabacteria bacterium]